VAQGTPTARVVFTSDSSQPHAGDWQGITFKQQTLPGQAILDYSTIEYAGGNGFAEVYCDSVAAQITNSVIRASSNYGVMLRKTGFAAFAGNDISSCQAYPVFIDPDFVSSAGANQLDRGLFVGDGTIRKSATWPYSGYPRVIGGQIEIGDVQHPVLSLLAGDTIQFANGAVLRVGSVWTDSGALNATGAVFTGISQLQGAWKGLEFRDYTINDSSWLLNSIVKFGGGDTLGDILCLHAAPRIRGNEIAYSSAWGIYLYNSPINPDSLRAPLNTFHNNVLGDVGP
jgi:hypothetical protein